MSSDCNRREFLHRMGTGMVGAGVVGSGLTRALAAQVTTQPAAKVGSIRDLPTRQMGRLGIQIPMLGFGTASMGHAFYQAEPFEEVVNAALDAGIRYVDTARIYDVAEERLAPILAKRRKEIFLVTKTWAGSKDDVLRSFEKSMSAMKVDRVDLCHMHNIGAQETEKLLAKDGALAGVLELKKRGLTKYIGCTGHFQVPRFVPVIDTGEIDAIMVAMNFVDHHTYGFQEQVLPTARKHNCAILCMKVYGGVTGSWDGYQKRRPGRLVGDEHRQDAFDYCLSIPDLCCAVVGMKSLEELRLVIEAVLNFKPLTGDRREQVLAKGAELAKEWKDHFGVVA